MKKIYVTLVSFFILTSMPSNLMAQSTSSSDSNYAHIQRTEVEETEGKSNEEIYAEIMLEVDKAETHILKITNFLNETFPIQQLPELDNAIHEATDEVTSLHNRLRDFVGAVYDLYQYGELATAEGEIQKYWSEYIAQHLIPITAYVFESCVAYHVPVAIMGLTLGDIERQIINSTEVLETEKLEKLAMLWWEKEYKLNVLLHHINELYNNIRQGESEQTLIEISDTIISEIKKVLEELIFLRAEIKEFQKYFEETTSISDIIAEQNIIGCYTLSGQKVSKPERGKVYIFRYSNGKTATRIAK